MYNVDELGFTMIQKKKTKVLAHKRKHQVIVASIREERVNATLVACTSAFGNFVPQCLFLK